MKSFAFWKTSALQDIDPSSPEYLSIQRDLILSRPLVKKNYLDWYRYMTNGIASYGTSSATLQVELGSGGGFLKDIVPDVVTSDVQPVKGVDLVIDGRKLPFDDNSVKAIYMTHVLHHIPDVESFFTEARRTLAVGGVIAMIEVAATPFARFFFDRFHPEPFLPNVESWSFNQSDAMLDSNQALSWIVFKRDIERFRLLFPELEVCETKLLPWFSYFVSGGVTKPYLIPDWCAPLVRAADRALSFTHPLCSLHWGIIIRKNQRGGSAQ